MALATRCPNCGAIFRVGAEQLTSRGGMVRCGSCRHVFNAIGRLDYVEPTPGSAENPTPRAASSGAADAEREERRRTPRPAPSPTTTQPAARAKTESSAPATAPQGKLAVSAPRAAGAAPPAAASPPGAASPAIHRLAALSPPPGAQSRRAVPAVASHEPTLTLSEPPIAPPFELTDSADDPSIPELEPNFLRAKDVGTNRTARMAQMIACVFLTPALVIQLALLFRSDLIVHWPDLQPALAGLCMPWGCSAQWPMRPELLAVVSSDLQAVPGTSALEFDVVIRNRAEFAMALPAVELTLTDSLNHPVARKIFTPADYLVASAATLSGTGESLAAGADLSIRLLFEYRGGSVAGFVAYPFYP